MLEYYKKKLQQVNKSQNQLEVELDDLKYKNSHTDKENYRYDLRDKNIPEGGKDRIAQKYIDAQGAGILKSLTDTSSKELSETAAEEIAHKNAGIAQARKRNNCPN